MSHRTPPNYTGDADYTTNAPSYYEDLARKAGLIKELAERIWGYEETLNLSLQEIAQRFIEWDAKIDGFDGDVNVLLQEWISDGTFDHIINDTIFSWKADQSDLDATNLQLVNIKSKIAYMSFFPRQGAEIDDTERIKRAIAALSTGGKLIFERITYTVSAQLTLSSYLNIEGNFAQIDLNGNAIDLFYTFQKEKVDINNLTLIDKVGTNTVFFLTGAIGVDGVRQQSDYSSKITVRNVHASGFNLGLKTDYARQLKFDHCHFYTKNGALLQNKSVEINFTDTIIFGSELTTDNYAIKLEKTSTLADDYPEGIMISGCTLDNYYRTLWINDVYVLQIQNSYIASDVAGDASIYFGNNTSLQCKSITVDNVVLAQKGIKFNHASSSPVLYHAAFSNIVFEEIYDTAIYMRSLVHDVSFSDIRLYGTPSNGGVVANCTADNKNVKFSNIWADANFAGGIYFKGANSDGSKIDGFEYHGTGTKIGNEQPILMDGILYSTIENLSNKHKDFIAATYNTTSPLMVSNTMKVAKGQRGNIIINAAVIIVDALNPPRLRVDVPIGVTLPTGAGWDAKYIRVRNNMYLSLTIPFLSTANINDGVFSINHHDGGGITIDSHSYMTLQFT